MSIVTIIIVAWSFVLTTEQIQPAKAFDSMNINKEAILEHHDEGDVVTLEEMGTISIEKKVMFEALTAVRHSNKERPAT
jgi:hypothetical protein